MVDGRGEGHLVLDMVGASVRGCRLHSWSFAHLQGGMWCLIEMILRVTMFLLASADRVEVYL